VYISIFAFILDKKKHVLSDQRTTAVTANSISEHASTAGYRQLG